MQQLIDYIEQFVKLDSETIEEIKKLARIEIYAKNQHILEQGQRCNKIWFIKSGMVRKYYIHERKEVTEEHLYQLEINSIDDELKTTYLEKEYKAITLMRWIRQGMEDNTLIQLK